MTKNDSNDQALPKHKSKIVKIIPVLYNVSYGGIVCIKYWMALLNGREKCYSDNNLRKMPVNLI